MGFLASAAAILIGFVPPSQFENGSDGAYVGLILAGTVLLGLLPPWLFLWRRKPSWKMAETGGATASVKSGDDTACCTGSSAASLVVLCVIGLITYSGKKETQEAQDKAQQLTQKFQAAGLRGAAGPGHLRRGRSGTDGGAVCDNPASALGKAALIDTITNGADFVGRRPVIIDRRDPAGRGADPARPTARTSSRTTRTRSTT